MLPFYSSPSLPHSLSPFLPCQSPRCKVCGAAPVIKTSDHIFLDLDKVCRTPLSSTIPHSRSLPAH